MPANFQDRVGHWLHKCFGKAIAEDKAQRSHRFLEEALELVQATGTTKEEAHMLVEYTFNRPVGELRQEVGGTMITLAALCYVHEVDMLFQGEIEYIRINKTEIIQKIRAKQATKPPSSPLPQ